MLHTTPGKGAGSVNGECQAKSAEYAAAIRKWRHQKIATREALVLIFNAIPIIEFA
ncbi:hypothetical protein [Burkholderia contaminans]|uniref:hypothetical protein n=1 Tax=Burkholderia contaminans TaxID=488447 RepID=UPI001364A1CE|nr:hypothetical protein [Burkholderia contaminans]ELK6462625.1 hypothetical protein [Burkholderia contaminans]MEB4629985.1 hypothetical protein [Burkholderia contaminans]MEB4636169.1 hypothetical protein [Burkholderia contaminans]MEB4650610.1 hypothetical protein [Burkholderia contaminans]MEB4660218.1 hypothetical protein [Burkholderia contaminans]